MTSPRCARVTLICHRLPRANGCRPYQYCNPVDPKKSTGPWACLNTLSHSSGGGGPKRPPAPKRFAGGPERVRLYYIVLEPTRRSRTPRCAHRVASAPPSRAHMQPTAEQCAGLTHRSEKLVCVRWARPTPSSCFFAHFGLARHPRDYPATCSANYSGSDGFCFAGSQPFASHTVATIGDCCAAAKIGEKYGTRQYSARPRTPRSLRPRCSAAFKRCLLTAPGRATTAADTYGTWRLRRLYMQHRAVCLMRPSCLCRRRGATTSMRTARASCVRPGHFKNTTSDKREQIPHPAGFWRVFLGTRSYAMSYPEVAGVLRIARGCYTRVFPPRQKYRVGWAGSARRLAARPRCPPHAAEASPAVARPARTVRLESC